jgi:hypothetical protein
MKGVPLRKDALVMITALYFFIHGRRFTNRGNAPDQRGVRPLRYGESSRRYARFALFFSEYHLLPLSPFYREG